MTSKHATIVIVYENFLYGGTSTHLINLLNSTYFKNLEVIIITNNNNQSIKNIKKNCKNINFIFFNSLNVMFLKHKILKGFFFLLKPLLFMISIAQFYILLRKVRYKSLLANCGGYGDFRSEIAAVFSSRLLGIKKNYLLIHHSYRSPKLWRSVVKVFDFFVLKFLKKIIFVSHATKKTVLKNSGLKPTPKKIVVIHNGVLIKNENKKIKKIFKNNNNILKIGMLSRIEKYKGQEDLLKSLLFLDNKYKRKVKIFIIGNGEKKYISRMKTFIHQQKLNKFIVFKKYLNEESKTIVKNFDILVSLTRDFEGFGYSLVEAMAHSVPVITTNVGGTKEVLNKNNANIVKPYDPRGVSLMIIDYLQNTRKWKKKAKLASIFIKKKFNSEIMSKKYAKIIISST